MKYITALTAVVMCVVMLVTGCGKTAQTIADTVGNVSETVPETAAETSMTEQTSETVSVETSPADTDKYPKGVNKVRTAEELADKKVIALTFDDGPNTAVTAEILDLLEEYGMVASFYVIGQNITPESAEVMRRAHAMGCEINSHSFTHSYMNEMTADEIKDEMSRTAELIYENTGEYPKFFRPPYIAVNSVMYDSIDLPFISGLGCNDWDDSVSVEKRVRFLTEKCPDGCIVLLHDQETNEKTVEALRQAIPVLLEQGFEFVTTEELFIAKGITPSADKEIIYSYATENGWG